MVQANDDEVRELVEELDRARHAWVNGQPESHATDRMVQAPGMTIFGPFGGEAVRNSGPEFEARQARLASKFQRGTGKSELVSALASGDLLVLVLIERSEVVFDGHTVPQPWVLRTTQVFRRDGARWLRLHRHADPLVEARSFEDTLVLAAGANTVKRPL